MSSGQHDHSHHPPQDPPPSSHAASQDAEPQLLKATQYEEPLQAQSPQAAIWAEQEQEQQRSARISRSAAPRHLPSFNKTSGGPSTITGAFPSSASASPVDQHPPPAPGQSSSSSKTADETISSTERAINKTNYYVNPGDSPRLRETCRDFYKFLASLPLPIVRFFPRIFARALARVLTARGIMASNYAFDLAMLFWRMIINIFFRSIQPRGAWRIPKNNEGPIIFVGAPHHNQFLDPLLLSSEVRRASGRRVAFLTAEKSLKRRFVGAAARVMQAIPVARAADSAKPGKGTVSFHSSGDPLSIQGNGTNFTKQLQVKGQICLPNEYGHASAEITEIISDTECKIKKEFKDVQGKTKVKDGLGSHDGVEYTCLPFVDQTQMYASVYDKLAEGGSLGIFPEGGSHDRTDLLPLKAGVVIMAIGAMAANPGLKVRIVPVGLSYFHPHRFRSRAVVEFGAPLDVPDDMVQLFSQGGDGKRKAVGQMMDIVFDGLKSVTVRAPDYETLMFIQAGRRLYVPPGQHTSLGQVVELNRKFILGYMRFKDEPRVQKVKDDVIKYNTKLRYAGLKDHQVERATRAGWKSLGLLAYRVGLLALWGGLALPGVILNSPIFILAKIISIRKAKEALAASQVKLKGRDVLATWKVLVSLVVAPILYTFYAGVATYLAHRYKLPVKHQLLMPLYAMAAQPAIAYSTLKFGEVGFDIYKSLPPLFISLLPGNHKVIQDLQKTRAQLSSEIHTIIEEFAPKIWEDFEQKRMLQPSAAKPPTRDNSGVGVSSTEDSVLAHPLAWLDERLFGWNSTSRRSGTEGSRRKAPISETESEKPSITEEERMLRQQYDAVLSANKNTSRDGIRSGSTTEEEEEDDDDSSYESDDGDYETVFGMIKNGMAVARSRSSSRRSSRSRRRSHSRSISGESFADKRNRSQNDLRLLAMSPSEQRPNPLSSQEDAGRSTAVPAAEGNAASRRARTHSLQENISAADLKSVAEGETSRQLPFKGASTVLETQAAGDDGKPSLGGKRRPPLEQIDSAAETPTGTESPKRQ